MKPWKKLGEELVYDGYRKIRRKRFSLPDGQTADYDTVGQNNQIVCTLALTSNREVILARQFRAGPERIFDELPGGGLDGNETPERAGARELLEETGYQFGKIELLTSTAIDGYTNGVRHHLVATDCVKIQESEGEKGNVPAEVVLVPLDEFKANLKQGNSTDITTAYLGLDHLHLL